MKVKILVLALALGSFFNVCLGNEKTDKTETIIPGNFESLKVSDNVRVILTNDDHVTSMRIEGDEKAISSIHYELKESKLTISRKGNRKGDVTLYLSAPHLNRVEATGDAKVSSDENIGNNSLTLVVKDHAEASIKSNVPVIDAYAFSDGIIRVIGDYASSSTYLQNYDVLVGKYIKNNGSEQVSVLAKR